MYLILFSYGAEVGVGDGVGVGEKVGEGVGTGVGFQGPLTPTVIVRSDS